MLQDRLKKQKDSLVTIEPDKLLERQGHIKAFQDFIREVELSDK